MNYLQKFFGHLHTVNTHRAKVCHYCFKCGLYWRGLTHDLSKYSPTEFLPGVKYFLGNRSPTVKERMERGYSLAWMHHKGRNRHHFEYWNDFRMDNKKYEPVEMPKQFLVEMFCDRISASKVYLKKNYTDASPLEYLLTKDKHDYMHPNTRKQITFLLNKLANEGEEKTFKFIKDNFHKKEFITMLME